MVDGKPRAAVTTERIKAWHATVEEKTGLRGRINVFFDQVYFYHYGGYDKVIEESGLPKELLGRISDIIVLNPLDKTMLKRILLESDASPLKTFKRFFEAAGCTLTIDDTFIDEVVEEAIASPFGARGLQRILHRKLMPKLFEKTQRQHTTYADALAMIGTRALK
jgi:ATP-dependent protease Clp ATPase subunit